MSRCKVTFPNPPIMGGFFDALVSERNYGPILDLSWQPGRLRGSYGDPEPGWLVQLHVLGVPLASKHALLPFTQGMTTVLDLLVFPGTEANGGSS